MMARIQGQFFSMDAARLTEVVRITRYPESVVREMALDLDWAEGEEHQTWLDNATPLDIASWIEVHPSECIEELR